MTLQSITCRLAAVAILTAGAVHFDLWVAGGYRAIHVIGPLFLANTIAAVVIAAALLARPGLLTATAGLLYAASTLGAFLLSVYVGLFGFTEVLVGTTQLVAGIAELTAIALLVPAVATGWRSRLYARVPAARPVRESRDLRKAA